MDVDGNAKTHDTQQHENNQKKTLQIRYGTVTPVTKSCHMAWKAHLADLKMFMSLTSVTHSQVWPISKFLAHHVCSILTNNI